ncbi:Similar to Scyl2: SCY1-like protein 2 (Mus musculus) [Cotesia congregata]|uniref:Similar to Scyl2: SCY1-like protein 2 (Mus musculus) n=1 Tax=Cotesia congregata TaxID=51543 RepID=A0A8J2MH57_COTCN|nr:Similar to Scyl2: SCY1-like protein 2 (Mus musculus) [Cotesia congregata]
MFKFKNTQPNIVESNPIWEEFAARKQTPAATAGPEHVWRIFDAYKKSDGQDASVFVFEKRSVEKFHKPKHKETVTEILRRCARNLEDYRHPKLLQVIHPVKECAETLAFATEPVLGSLANVLAYREQAATAIPTAANPNSNYAAGQQNPHQQPPGHRPILIKEYDMVPMEIKYGLLQVITEALSFLHCSCKVIHKNVCPSSIIITKKGTWKLFGLEFIDPIPCHPWTNKISKIIQPNLDYIAPEIQLTKLCSIRSDMFSLGMVIATIYNDGRSLIQANHSNSDYIKQLDNLNENVENLLSRVPIALHEAVSRLLHKDPEARPIAKHLSLIKYFSDPSVHALQFLDVINMKDPNQKAHFYRNTLKEVLPFIPLKLWYQHIWPYLQAESKSQEVFASVLQPMLFIIQQSNTEDYEKIILPSFRELFSSPRSVQGTVVLLENLHVVFEKTPSEIINGEMLPVLYSSFESPNIQVQAAAFVAVSKVCDYIDENSLKNIVLPKLMQAFEGSTTDSRVLMNCLSRILEQLDTQQITDEVFPLLWEIKLQEPDAVLRVVNIYRLLLSNKKYGLSINLLATRVMPILLPVTVNPSLNIDQFTVLMEILQDMLTRIERNQASKLKLSMSSPERHRPLRHQFSTENMHVPPFNIPGLRIEQRKTSSAEDMVRKTSIGSMSMTASAENMTRKNSMSGSLLGGWWFGSSSSANEGGFLRVASAFPSRRLSDNTLMTPKIRIAPSCSSSPGGTPGGGLPIRRHSSTGPQERRGSNVNLSPPTGGMPATSNSVPYLLSSSMTSIRNSRRPSVSSTTSQQGSGLLQQFGTGMNQRGNWDHYYPDDDITPSTNQVAIVVTIDGSSGSSSTEQIRPQ